jgi:hypothetical protein
LTLGKSGSMPRSIVLIIILIFALGLLYFLSTLPRQQPTHPIEMTVPQPSPAGGNAH